MPTDRIFSSVIIADCSSSALPYLRQTLETIAIILKELPGNAVHGIYILGSRHCYHPASWTPELSLPKHILGSGSFLAPVMERLQREDIHPECFLIVGAGQVFDLEDYALQPERWALINIGPTDPFNSLQAQTGRFLEVSPGMLDEVFLQLKNLPDDKEMPQARAASGVIRQKWKLDRCGFPMVYIEPIRCFLNLFPITHPQYEHFMCDAHRADYDDAWYISLLEAAGSRLSPRAASLENFTNLLVTGILPAEVQAYIEWHGEGLRLPKVSEWQQAWNWLSTQHVSALPSEIEYGMAPIAHAVWDGLAARLEPKNLLELSLMTNGVLEWIQESNDRWVGIGKPPSHPYHDPIRDHPLAVPSLTRRSKRFGFRLIRSV